MTEFISTCQPTVVDQSGAEDFRYRGNQLERRPSLESVGLEDEIEWQDCQGENNNPIMDMGDVSSSPEKGQTMGAKRGRKAGVKLAIRLNKTAHTLLGGSSDSSILQYQLKNSFKIPAIQRLY